MPNGNNSLYCFNFLTQRALPAFGGVPLRGRQPQRPRCRPSIPAMIEARSKEILTLSKMNWNSSDGITKLPVTLLFAKKVGEIMTELSDNVSPNESFRFHT
jgi:hypothetical protein